MWETHDLTRRFTGSGRRQPCVPLAAVLREHHLSWSSKNMEPENSPVETSGKPNWEAFYKLNSTNSSGMSNPDRQKLNNLPDHRKLETHETWMQYVIWDWIPGQKGCISTCSSNRKWDSWSVRSSAAWTVLLLTLLHFPDFDHGTLCTEDVHG